LSHGVRTQVAIGAIKYTAKHCTVLHRAVTHCNVHCNNIYYNKATVSGGRWQSEP